MVVQGSSKMVLYEILCFAQSQDDPHYVVLRGSNAPEGSLTKPKTTPGVVPTPGV